MNFFVQFPRLRARRVTAVTRRASAVSPGLWAPDAQQRWGRERPKEPGVPKVTLEAPGEAVWRGLRCQRHQQGQGQARPPRARPGSTCSAESRAAEAEAWPPALRVPQGPSGATGASPGSEAPAREVPTRLFGASSLISFPVRSSALPHISTPRAKPEVHALPPELLRAECVGQGGRLLTILEGES